MATTGIRSVPTTAVEDRRKHRRWPAIVVWILALVCAATLLVILPRSDEVRRLTERSGSLERSIARYAAERGAAANRVDEAVQRREVSRARWEELRSRLEREVETMARLEKRIAAEQRRIAAEAAAAAAAAATTTTTPGSDPPLIAPQPDWHYECHQWCLA